MVTHVLRCPEILVPKECGHVVIRKDGKNPRGGLRGKEKGGRGWRKYRRAQFELSHSAAEKMPPDGGAGKRRMGMKKNRQGKRRSNQNPSRHFQGCG